MHPVPSFSELLRRYRIAASLSQEALAERAGLSVRGISDLERGVNTQPRLETVRLLAEALGLSVEQRTQFAMRARINTPSEVQRTTDDQHPVLMPVPLTSLLGRESDLAVVAGLLRKPQIRLVTLTGPGGIGKTRLARALLTDVASFADGGQFVSLVTVADPTLIVDTVAQAFGLQEGGGQPLRQQLMVYLRPRQLLLVLDNFEHLLSGAPLITDLLSACPALKVLVTSRAALRLSAEQLWPVPPLALPDLAQGADPSLLLRAPAVDLFVQRARAVDPAFRLDDSNASAVAALCAGLDGLPLAIELAAARITLFAPQAMLARMGNALQFLGGGPRDQPSRQQTLRDTIAWSYGLLTPTEQALFACLAIFVGGWTLAAAEAAYAAMDGDAYAVLDATAALVNHNLIRREAHTEGEPRFGMLETIREYARECLVASGREDRVARAHCMYYLTHAEQVRPALYTQWSSAAKQSEALAWFTAEHDNLRAALQWAVTVGEAEIALRLAIAAKLFWQIRGHLTEGRRWFAAALAHAEGVPPPLRGLALDLAGWLIGMQGDYAAARAHIEESLAIARAYDAKESIASSLFGLAMIAHYESDYAGELPLLQESLAIARALGDMHRVGLILINLGTVARQRGEHRTARSHLEESLQLLREAGDRQHSTIPLHFLGVLARDVGDYATARIYLEESLAISRTFGETYWQAHSLGDLGIVARDEGDYIAASERYAESLAIVRALGDRRGIVHSLVGLAAVEHRAGNDGAAHERCTEALRMADTLGDRESIALCLDVLAEIAGARGDALHAARLWAAAAELRAGLAIQLPPVDRTHQEQTISAVRAGCADSAWHAAWQEGHEMEKGQVARYALGIPQDQ